MRSIRVTTPSCLVLASGQTISRRSESSISNTTRGYLIRTHDRWWRVCVPRRNEHHYSSLFFFASRTSPDVCLVFEHFQLAHTVSVSWGGHWQVSWPKTFHQQLPWTVVWARPPVVAVLVTFKKSSEKAWDNSVQHRSTHSTEAKHDTTHASRYGTWKKVVNGPWNTG